MQNVPLWPSSKAAGCCWPLPRVSVRRVQPVRGDRATDPLCALGRRTRLAVPSAGRVGWALRGGRQLSAPVLQPPPDRAWPHRSCWAASGVSHLQEAQPQRHPGWQPLSRCSLGCFLRWAFRNWNRSSERLRGQKFNQIRLPFLGTEHTQAMSQWHKKETTSTRKRMVFRPSWGRNCPTSKWSFGHCLGYN